MTHLRLFGHASEVSKPGDYKLLPCGFDIDQIAVCNVDGETLRAFDNVCPHRGARIFPGFHGYGNGAPRCAYHGRVTQPEDMCASLFNIGGWLFVKGGRTPASLPVLAFLNGAGPLRVHGRVHLEMNCHWTVAVENALEHEHVPTVHGNSLAKLRLREIALSCADTGDSIQTFSTATRRSRDHDRRVPGTKDFDYKHALIFPFTAVSSTRGWTYSMQHYLPRPDGTTLFLHTLLVPADAPESLNFFYDSVLRLNRQVFEEDAAICERVWLSFAGNPNELPERIRHFRDHVLKLERVA